MVGESCAQRIRHGKLGGQPDLLLPVEIPGQLSKGSPSHRDSWHWRTSHLFVAGLDINACVYGFCDVTEPMSEPGWL